jgi:hypothetical protein
MFRDRGLFTNSKEVLADGAVLLRGFAEQQVAELFAAITTNKLIS